MALATQSPIEQVGAPPRGGIALLALARAYVLAHGRGYVLPDDVKALPPTSCATASPSPTRPRWQAAPPTT
jgi:MoxR-like ATPase